MNKENYPTWLVTLEIAKELKEIGFDEPCHAFIREDDGYIQCYTNNLGIHRVINNSKLTRITNECVSLPTWEQVFAWFRAKGYKITFKDINIGTQCAFYHLDIKEGHTFSHFAKKYEKAREGLVMKLIEVHKEFGNNIKRFD